MNSHLSGRCFLSILDFDPEDLLHSLELAATVKQERHLGKEATTSAALEGTYIALLFEKPSHDYTKELLKLMPKIESIYN